MAEIDNLDILVFINQNVLWLYIPVNIIFIVHLTVAVQQLGEELEDHALGQASLAHFGSRSYVLVEGFAPHELGHYVNACYLFRVLDPLRDVTVVFDDVGVVEHLQRLNLFPPAFLLVIAHVLQGHHAVVQFVVALVHGAELARPDAPHSVNFPLPVNPAQLLRHRLLHMSNKKNYNEITILFENPLRLT